MIKARRIWLEEENKRLQAAIINLEKHNLMKAAMEHMSERLRANLDGATSEGWRFILEALRTKVSAFGNGNWDIEINIPISDAGEMREPIKDETACASEL